MPPIVDAPAKLTIPPPNSTFTDMLQWLCLHHPLMAKTVERMIAGFMAKQRTARPPGVSSFCNGQLEYTHVVVTDETALLAPVEGRLGRKIHDVIPAYAVEDFYRCHHAVKQTGHPKAYVQTRPDGSRWDVAVMSPHSDLVMVHVERAAPFLTLACVVGRVLA